MAQQYVVTQEQIDGIASIAAEKAVEAYRAEEGRARRRMDNANARITKEKLQSYRRAKAAISEGTEFTDDEKVELRWKFVHDLMGVGVSGIERAEDRIRTIENKRKRDLFETQMIDKALAMYEAEAERTGNEEFSRRLRELKAMYTDEAGMTAREIADAEGISEKTVYHDLGIACRILSEYLIGM